MHTTDPAALHSAHREPRFISWIMAAIIVGVVIVAVVANGAAYLGGLSFAQNVMQLSPLTAKIFGGVIELALAVVAGATLVEAYRLQPTGALRTATWALSGVSGAFGALYEIVEYLDGTLTFVAAASSAGWRVFAPFLAAGLWELVIYLVCGRRHRAHRAAEVRQARLFTFFKAVEREGLVHGTWRAPLAAAMSRRASRAIAKTVAPDERDAELTRWLDSQRYAQHVRVSGAALAAATDAQMRTDIAAHATAMHTVDAVQPTDAVATATATTTAPAPAAIAVHSPDATAAAAPIAVQTVQAPVATAPAATAAPVAVQQDDYDARVRASVQAEAEAILAETRTTDTTTAARTNSVKAAAHERQTIVQQIVEQQPGVLGKAIHAALTERGFKVSARTAFNDLNAVKRSLALAATSA